MDQRGLESLVDYYLGALVTAGDYARAIQRNIAGPAEKSGPNAWAQAVTDADLAVQTYLEVATLARDPGLGFFGEEHAQSRNHKYFDADAPVTVNVDPVNGTFLYRNGRDGWDIILSIARRGRLIAAVSYMPARGIFYLAVDGHGALTGDRRMPTLAAMAPLATRSGSRVCLTYQAPAVIKALRGRFAAFDLVADYDPARDIDNLNDLFTGRLDAFVCRGGDLLDWGAVAYIVAAAGGRVSTLSGEPLAGFEAFVPDRQADMLVAASPAVHEEILALLG
jgi:fructose-1,6-bisphosphatase/inositol monophosphatase family enzyme